MYEVVEHEWKHTLRNVREVLEHYGTLGVYSTRRGDVQLVHCNQCLEMYILYIAFKVCVRQLRSCIVNNGVP